MLCQDDATTATNVQDDAYMGDKNKLSAAVKNKVKLSDQVLCQLHTV